MDSNYSDALNTVSGVLVIDKPVGLTSHDVVQVVRRGPTFARAGHTGTLDARIWRAGCAGGSAVRLSEYVSASDKRYQAVVELGVTTDTFDADGSVTSSAPVDVTEEQFSEALASFVGESEQVPPPYSAVRVKGRRAYDLARKARKWICSPAKSRCTTLELLEWDRREAVIDVSCSSGTYVRSLANDLGTKLGCGADLVGLLDPEEWSFHPAGCRT